MIPFRERNKTVIGGVGILAILAVLAGSFSIDKLIGGDEYKAEFTEAAGLKPNDEVRIAGVKVGKVLTVGLAQNRVQVSFRVKDVELGMRTRADISIKTLLGRKFLSVSPDGEGTLSPGSMIPVARTTSPFDITDAFQDLSTSVGDIDTEQLAKSFTTLADTFRDTPDEVKASLTGLSRLSNTIASRDAELKQLLTRTRGVSQVLAERDQDLVGFLDQSSLVFQEIQLRRQAITKLLDTTTELSAQLSALVRENRATLRPALAKLRDIVIVLRQNKDNLDKSLVRLAPFVRIFADNLGNGRWFDTIVENLADPTGLAGLIPGTFGDGTSGPLLPLPPAPSLPIPGATK